MTEIESRLNKLSPSERKVLQSLALFYEPLTATDFVALMNKLEIRTADGKAMTANYAGLLRNSLLHKQFLREVKNSWNSKTVELASDDLRRELTREAVAADWFATVAADIRDYFPASDLSRWGNENLRRQTRLLRDFRLQILAQKPFFGKSFAELEHENLTGAALGILTEIFTEPFQTEFLARFDAETQTAMLQILLRDALETFAPLAPLLEFARAQKLDAQNFLEFEIVQAVFTGELKRAKNLLGDAAPENPAVLSAAGLIALLERDFARSVNLFDAAIKIWRKTKGKRKGFPITWPMFFYGLALYRQDEVLFHRFIEEFSASAQKNEAFAAAPGFLNVLNHFLKNADGAAKMLFNRIASATLTDKLLKIITAALVPAIEPTTAEITDFVEQARRRNYRWLELEFLNLLKTKNQPDSKATRAAAEAAEKLQSAIGIEPVGNLVRPLEDWERALKILQSVAVNLAGGGGETKTAENETRVAWLLDFEQEEIQPIEQKFSKTGWTAGRNIALKRLHQRDVKNLTEQDNRIIKTALRRNAAYYYGDDYYLKWAAAVPELVNHPLLFSSKNPSVNLQLETGEPTLMIKEKKGELELSFDTKFDAEGIIVKKETETRWKIIKVAKRHVDIAAVLSNKRLKIPAAGRAELLKAIQPLSTQIAISSDLEEHFENLPSVAADVRIYALITPRGEGFHLEFFVKPFGKIPPYFKPGKNQEQVIAELDGTRTRTARDLKAERRLLNEIEELCPTLAADENPNYEWELTDAEACLNALVELEKPRQADKLVIEWPKGQKLKLAGTIDFDNLRLQVKSKNEWFEISGEVRVNEDLVFSMRELNDLLRHTNADFVELSDGQFLAVTEKLRKHLQSLAAATDDKGRLHQLRSNVLTDFADELVDFKADKAWRDHLAKLESLKSYVPEIPPTFEADLRPYQIEGFQWLSRLAKWGVGACLADDMGLGKTLMALAVLVERAELGAALVVAPVSVCRNWIKEAAKFAPTLNFHLFGAGDRKATIDQLQKYDVLVTSYNLLQAEAEMFTERRFATIVLDEAQAVKNRQTKRSQTVMRLQGDFRVVTTGTPIENHTGELWNLFNFINPGLLGGHDFFTQRFAVPIEKNKDETARRTLQTLIRPFVLRRRKNQVLDDLPPKTEIVLSVEMSPEERAFYEAARREALENIERDAGETGDKRFRIMAELTRLRLACCHPRLISENANVGNGKLDVFGEVLDELLENKHKALVFSQFVKHLKLVEDYLRRRAVKYQYLDGSTPAHVRQERIDDFQRGTGGDIFLISLKAGGTGLNLTAADYVIHLDPWWNPAVEDQATDRVHRIGQQRPVTVYRIIAENTVEEKILKLHETKRDLADNLLDGTDASGKLSAEDLLNLIKTG